MRGAPSAAVSSSDHKRASHELVMLLQGCRPINFINVYASTLQATDEEKEHFHIVESIPLDVFLVLSGDFNAQVDKDDANFCVLLCNP